MTVGPLHRIKCRKRNSRRKSILRIYSSSDYKKRKSPNRCKRRPPNQQNNRIKTVRLKKTRTYTRSDGNTECIGQMTSCVGISLLVCRALLSVAGEGGVVPSFCLLFFASGGSSHGCTSFVLCLGRETTTSKACSLSLHLSWNGHGQFT